MGRSSVAHAIKRTPSPHPLLEQLLAVPKNPFGNGARALRRRTPKSGAALARGVAQLLGFAVVAAALLLALIYVHVAIFSIKFLGAVFVGGAAAAGKVRDALRGWIFGARSERRTVEIMPFRGGFQLVEPWGTRESYMRPARLVSATRTEQGLHVRIYAAKEGDGATLVDLEAPEHVIETLLDGLDLHVAGELRNDHPLGLPPLTVPSDVEPFLAALDAHGAAPTMPNYRSCGPDESFLRAVAEDERLPEEERVGALLLLARRRHEVPLRIDDSPLVRVAAQVGHDADDAVLGRELRRVLTQDP